MNKYRITTAIIATFLGLGAMAQAADLKNTDEASYTIYIETDDATKTLVISPHETLADICSDCYIGIEETDSGVSVENEAMIIIRNGQLVIED